MYVRVQKLIQTPITKNREVLFYQLHIEDNVLTSTYIRPRLPKSGGNKKNYTVVKVSLNEQIIVGWAGRKSNHQDIPGDAETVQHLPGLS